jgi:hypothetical protein
MWRLIAETVGDETLKNPDAYSWHTCRYAAFAPPYCMYVAGRSLP